MLCPNCQTTLQIADRAGVEIDFCPSCRGVWLDRGELDKIIERSTAHASAPPRGGSGGSGQPAAEQPQRQESWLEQIFDIFD